MRLLGLTLLTPFIVLLAGQNVAAQNPPPANHSLLYPDQPLHVRRIRTGANGEIRNVSYLTSHGFAIVDGDVKFGTLADLEYANPNIVYDKFTMVKKRAHSVFAGQRTWPNAQILYKYDGDDTEASMKPLVDQAMARWLKGAPYLTFRKLPNSPVEENGVAIFTDGCGPCWSDIGYSPYQSLQVNLQLRCKNNTAHCELPEAVHEIGHLIGLYHEHQRSDRDNTVEYHCENVDPRCPPGVSMPAGKNCCDRSLPDTTGCCASIFNFDKYVGPEYDATGSYDLASVMQYRSWAFARPGTRGVIVPKDPRIQIPVDKPVDPSATDFERVCKMYAGQCPLARSCAANGCIKQCQTSPSCSSSVICKLRGPWTTFVPSCCKGPTQTCTGGSTTRLPGPCLPRPNIGCQGSAVCRAIPGRPVPACCNPGFAPGPGQPCAGPGTVDICSWLKCDFLYTTTYVNTWPGGFL